MIKAALLLAIIAGPLTSKAAGDADVRVIGQMRRMFMAHDIGPNVDLQDVAKQQQHVYGLGPLASLKGEVTIVDSEVFTSQVKGDMPRFRSTEMPKPSSSFTPPSRPGGLLPS